MDYEARVERMLAYVEQQQQAQQLQASYEDAAHRNPDIDPSDLAEAGEIFGYDFDATAEGIRHFRAEAQAEYEAANPPATIHEAVDQLMSKHSG